MSGNVQKRVDNYQFFTRDIVGSGSFGKVYKGKNVNTEEQVAIKIITKSAIQSVETLKRSFLQEIQCMKTLNDPNIVKLIDVFETTNNYYLVQEFCGGGDLRKFLKDQPKLVEKSAKWVLCEILRGFQQLIQRGVIHRDLKPENLLTTPGKFLNMTNLDSSRIKIADFGLARTLHSFNHQLLSSVVGTPVYMSPQILQHNKYTTKSDIWSIGVIFYELLTGRLPWTARSPSKLLSNIVNEPLTFPDGVYDLIIIQEVSTTCQNFIQGCLRLNERDRFDWNAIYEHPLISNEFKTQLTKKSLSDQMPFIINNLRVTIASYEKSPATLLKSVAKGKNFLEILEFTELFGELDPNLLKEQIEVLFDALDEGKQKRIQVTDIQKWIDTEIVARKGDVEHEKGQHHGVLASPGKLVAPTVTDFDCRDFDTQPTGHHNGAQHGDSSGDAAGINKQHNAQSPSDVQQWIVKNRQLQEAQNHHRAVSPR